MKTFGSSSFLCWILVLGASAASGQDAGVRGVVTDLAGNAIDDAEVLLLDDAQEPRQTLTASDGAFRFDGLSPGTYEIVVSREGFRSVLETVVVTPDRESVIDVVLQFSYAESVVVSVARDDRPLLTSMAAVTILDSEDIIDSAADNFGSLLRSVPGLNVLQIGSRDFNVNARNSSGILSNSMLVMVDGRAVYQPAFGGVYWDLMPVSLNEIDSIEVVRTPASVVWGANAMTGVINLRTKSPRQMQGFRASMGAGEIGTLFASASYAEARGDVSYKIAGSYYEQDAWERDDLLPDGTPMPPTVTFENKGTKQPKFDARVDWDLDGGSVFSMRGGIVSSSGLIFSSLGPSETSNDGFSSFVEADYTSEAMDAKVSWTRLDGPFTLVLSGLEEDNLNDTITVDVARRLTAAKRHRLTYGGAARLDHFDLTLTPDDSTRTNFGAFLEDAIEVNDSIDVSVGARIDKFDSAKTVFAPRAGIVVKPTPTQSVRFTFSRAFRGPSLLENYVDRGLPTVIPLDPLPPFVFPTQVLGSQELAVEKLDAFELGYSVALGGRTAAFVTLYHQYITDKIRFVPISFYGPDNVPAGWPFPPEFFPVLTETFSLINAGRVRDQGVELAVRTEWPRFTFQASYAFKDRPELTEGDLGIPFEINRPPRHQGGAGIAYDGGIWNASVDVNYTDQAFWADVFDESFWGYTESYTNVNATFRIRPPSWPVELRVTASNLFDDAYKAHVYGDTIRRKIMAYVTWDVR